MGAQIEIALIFIRLLENDLEPIRLEAIELALALRRHQFAHRPVAKEPQPLAALAAPQRLAEEIDEKQPFGAAEAEDRPGAHQPEGHAIDETDDAGGADQDGKAARAEAAAGIENGL